MREKMKIQNEFVNDQTQKVAKINIEYENVQQTLPDLRLKENQIAAELQKFAINLDNQEKEIDRANSAVEETQIRIEQIKNDINREQFLYDDANENIENSIAKMFDIASEVVIFDIYLSNFTTYRDPSSVYYSHEEIVNYCYSLTNSLIYIGNYNPYQIMMVLFKEQNRGFRNRI